ncbi:MAG: hypothetical protein HY867_11820 [Chloroflexi bacterium]|nr:hypothetical protein [Chloroflexota bacterium]
MLAKISTIMNTTPEFLWKEITKPQSLQYVAAPILYFFPTGDTDLNRDWELNRVYNLALFFLKFIPLGAHKIVIKKIDVSGNQIVSNESGALAKVWNHTIQFNSINSHQIEYADTIEIKAGLLTLFIWAFSHIFYRHRQRRWKQLLSRKTDQELLTWK